MAELFLKSNLLTSGYNKKVQQALHNMSVNKIRQIVSEAYWAS